MLVDATKRGTRSMPAAGGVAAPQPAALTGEARGMIDKFCAADKAKKNVELCAIFKHLEQEIDRHRAQRAAGAPEPAGGADQALVNRRLAEASIVGLNLMKSDSASKRDAWENLAKLVASFRKAHGDLEEHVGDLRGEPAPRGRDQGHPDHHHRRRPDSRTAVQEGRSNGHRTPVTPAQIDAFVEQVVGWCNTYQTCAQAAQRRAHVDFNDGTIRFVALDTVTQQTLGVMQRTIDIANAAARVLLLVAESQMAPIKDEPTDQLSNASKNLDKIKATASRWRPRFSTPWPRSPSR